MSTKKTGGSQCVVDGKTHYQRNRQRYLDKQKARRIMLRDFVRQQKLEPCTDCGRTYPYYVMDFDHLGDKDMQLSEMIRRGIGFERMQAEIDKCELVCANCHRERTHKRIT